MGRRLIELGRETDAKNDAKCARVASRSEPVDARDGRSDRSAVQRRRSPVRRLHEGRRTSFQAPRRHHQHD